MKPRIVLERIRRALDPLRARLRREELRQLSGRIAATLPGDAGDLAFVLALLDEADAAAAERADRGAALDRLADAIATHGEAAAPTLIADHLRARGESGAELELDAVVEKEARVIGRLDGTRELCLSAAGFLSAEALTGDRLAGQSLPAPSRLAPESALPSRLVNHAADRAAPYTVRVAALEAARQLLAGWRWPAPAHAVNALDHMADDASDNRWVQIAALRALAAADIGRARVRARARVLAPRPTGDDVIVRARIVRLLLSELHDPAAGAALGVAARDGSEHVRQSVARACATSGDPACRQILAVLSDPAREHSPRVRAVAALAQGDRAAGSAGQSERVHAARALARILVWDADPLPLGVAADTAAAGCALRDVDADAREILATALAQARARADVDPAVANLIARAAERATVSGSELRVRLGEAIAAMPESGSTRVAVPAGISDDEVGRTLAELAQTDLGIYAGREGDTLVLQRGDKLERRAWRFLHELKSPLPSKRQGHLHTVGKVYDGALRAHPGGMAEIAPTRVPGERVYVQREGGWASYLPLVDDFLSLGGAGARLYSEHGCTVITAPETHAGRMHARTRLTVAYADLAALRLRSLESGDAAGRGAYVAAMRDLGFGIRFEAYEGGALPEHVTALYARRRRAGAQAGDSVQPIGTMMAMAPLGLAGAVEGLGRMLGDPGAGGVGELALFTGAAAVLLAGRSIATRADISSSRRAIPLVVGGWGTRGKSGVERLKAALFHSLGYEVVSKTTGCEATVLVGVPGRPLVEVPLYRPYEKATIWEQRDVLRFAGTRKPHVLLWECMALNPNYVDLLQRGWMRDDISTLTNAYPDHEDIQGPSGLDVARVIAGFTPAKATLVTAEEQMLPIIRERAKSEHTKLVTVGPHADELLPADLLARFPYQEHPRNVALVMSLAEELGIDPEMALIEMADHVLPDVGGLRTFGPLPIGGRKLRFHNGMSANERASAVGNWRRLGLDAHRVGAEPERWIVALVNNRADRAARTIVFADALVDEFAAHRIVLCGSNTGGLRQAIEEAVGQKLARLSAAQIPDLLAHLKIGAATPSAALTELHAWAAGAVGPAAAGSLTRDALLETGLQEALASLNPEDLDTATRRVEESGAPARLRELLQALEVDDATAAELVSFARASWARRRVGAGLRAAPLSAASGAALRELFLERIVEPNLPVEKAGDADALAAAVAAACPPGVTVEIMGLQNIKGPGLAMVHMFAAGERALSDVTELEAGPPEAREAALARLAVAEGLSPLLLEAIADRLESRVREAGERERIEAVADRLRARAALARSGGARARTPRAVSRMMAALKRSFDHFSSNTRRRKADALFNDLARGRLAVSRAARELGDVNSEQNL